jgi:RNA polymerase sigma-70 factor (ECF subfamily)
MASQIRAALRIHNVSDATLSAVAAVTPEALARDHAPRVFRFARMLCHNPADSEDLAQEALLKAMRSLHQFNASRGSLDTWLWTIVVNVARDAGRASTRAETLWERVVSGQLSETGADEVETLALRRLSDAQLLEEVTRLPRRYRALIALRFGGDLSYDEIALLLHESPAALRQAMRRALKALRIRLEERDEPNA